MSDDDLTKARARIAVLERDQDRVVGQRDAARAGETMARIDLSATRAELDRVRAVARRLLDALDQQSRQCGETFVGELRHGQITGMDFSVPRLCVLPDEHKGGHASAAMLPPDERPPDVWAALAELRTQIDQPPTQEQS